MTKASAFLLKISNGAAQPTYSTVAGMRVVSLQGDGSRISVDRLHEVKQKLDITGTGIFIRRDATARVAKNELDRVLDDYELSFESGERVRGRFWVTRLVFNSEVYGERNYTIALESQGKVTVLMTERPTAEVELLSCGHCGTSGPRICKPTCTKDTAYNPADRAFPVVRCRSCYAEVPGKNWDHTGQSAIEAWNTRTPQQTEAVEALRAERNAAFAEVEQQHNTIVRMTDLLNKVRREIARGLPVDLATLDAAALSPIKGDSNG